MTGIAPETLSSPKTLNVHAHKHLYARAGALGKGPTLRVAGVYGNEAALKWWKGRMPTGELAHKGSTRSLQQAGICGPDEYYVSCSAPPVCQYGAGCRADGREVCLHAKAVCEERGGACNLAGHWVSVNIPGAGAVLCDPPSSCNGQGNRLRCP